MAFPSHERKAADPDFLAPFLPSDFSAAVEPRSKAHVHERRNQTAGFLFRIDLVPASVPSRHVIVVQSVIEPDWDYAFHNTTEFLCATPLVRPLSLTCSAGQRLRFRLRANPVCKRDGKRHRLRIPEELFNASAEVRDRAFDQALRDWLEGKLGSAVEQLEVADERLVKGWSHGWRTKHEPQPSQRMQFWSVLFEGTFVVHDPNELRQLIVAGIGPAKAFGFGLLSIAPAHS
jgi:CRISPR system Cascade subunit CasE